MKSFHFSSTFWKKNMANPELEADINKRLFVAVHAGAGFHSEEKTAEYKDLCRKACYQAMVMLKKKKSAADAVTAAVSVLEDSKLSNAGRGSNLTINGTVECDACVMEGRTSLFGAVGCVSGVLNPVQVACHLLQSQQHCSLSLGRVPPSVLVGTGARNWAKEQGFPCEDHHKLITDNSKRLYQKYKRRLERAEESISAKTARCSTDNGECTTHKFRHTLLNGPSTRSPSLTISPPNIDNMDCDGSKIHSHISAAQKCDDHGINSDKKHTDCNTSNTKKDVTKGFIDDAVGPSEESPAQDTVGAVCVDWEGNVSAAVSSGGIWLKHPGRLGPAAMYGAGCWAQNADVEGLPAVAVITSGCGEHIMRTTLAKTCADCLVSAEDATEGLRVCFSRHFLGSRHLSGIDNRLAGAVAVRIIHTEQGVPDVEVCWGHTTESMALGYLRGDGHRPKTLISRLSEGCQAGHSFTMSSTLFLHSS